MKKFLVILGLLFLSCVNNGQALALSLSLIPQNEIVGAGSSGFFSLLYSSAPGELRPVLGAFDLEIAFDPSVATFKNIFFPVVQSAGKYGLGKADTVMGVGSDPLSETDIILDATSPGGLRLGVVSLLFSDDLAILQSQVQPGPLRLATIEFQTINELNLSTEMTIQPDVLLANADGDALTGVTLNHATLSTVPEPSTIFLVASGLVSLLVWRPRVKAGGSLSEVYHETDI